MRPYLNFYRAALTKYKVHSPFVFEFVNDVFEDQRFYHAFGLIEDYRRNLLGNAEKILAKNQEQTINQLSKNELEKKYGAILFKTILKYKPKTILEIGTGLGVATLYQAMPNSTTPVITLSEETVLARKTIQYFNQLGTRNITLLPGPIHDSLPKSIAILPTLDFIFFNDFWGTTTTLGYLETCLQHIHSDTIIVVNQPNASTEKTQFWQSIKQLPQVKLSLDLFNLGFVFFRSEQKEVAHYQLIESWKKPWAVGFRY